MTKLFSLLMVVFASSLLSFGPTNAQENKRHAQIAAADVSIGATLTFPENCPTAGCPAMVLGHGSAPTTRNDLGFYKNIALKLGYAVLAYDKRGVGESTGKYERFDVSKSTRVFCSLAKDMSAVTIWLAEQDGINAERIGFLGGSQAGWIMPLAANLGAPVSFIIIGEGVPLSAGEEAAHGQYFVEHFGSEASPDIVFRDVNEADEVLEAYDGPAGFDPEAVLASIDTPILWIFGLSDTVIPVLPSLRRLETAIAAGQSNHDIHVFPYGDHNFTNTSDGTRYDLAKIVGPWLTALDESQGQ